MGFMVQRGIQYIFQGCDGHHGDVRKRTPRTEIER